MSWKFSEVFVVILRWHHNDISFKTFTMFPFNLFYIKIFNKQLSSIETLLLSYYLIIQTNIYWLLFHNSLTNIYLNFNTFSFISFSRQVNFLQYILMVYLWFNRYPFYWLDCQIGLWLCTYMEKHINISIAWY